MSQNEGGVERCAGQNVVRRGRPLYQRARAARFERKIHRLVFVSPELYRRAGVLFLDIRTRVSEMLVARQAHDGVPSSTYSAAQRHDPWESTPDGATQHHGAHSGPPRDRETPSIGAYGFATPCGVQCKMQCTPAVHRMGHIIFDVQPLRARDHTIHVLCVVHYGVHFPFSPP